MSISHRHLAPAFVGVIFIYLLSGCNPEPVSKGKSSPENIEKSLPEVDSISQAAEVKFPMLNNANAEEFLLKYLRENKARKLELTTRVGTLKIRLYDDTPLHTANFLMLVEREYFDNTEFTRVVKDFVVQGGNNDNEAEEIKRMLIGNYQISPEIKQKYYHRKGVLAMARQYENNPEKRSSAYDFYFVHGRTFNEPQLMAIERDHDMKIPEAQREVYLNTGGAPHLDGQHTVFGEIYEGLDVLDKMANVPTDASNWPEDPLIMKIRILDE